MPYFLAASFKDESSTLGKFRQNFLRKTRPKKDFEVEHVDAPSGPALLHIPSKARFRRNCAALGATLRTTEAWPPVSWGNKFLPTEIT